MDYHDTIWQTCVDAMLAEQESTPTTVLPTNKLRKLFLLREQKREFQIQSFRLLRRHW